MVWNPEWTERVIECSVSDCWTLRHSCDAQRSTAHFCKHEAPDQLLVSVCEHVSDRSGLRLLSLVANE